MITLPEQTHTITGGTICHREVVSPYNITGHEVEAVWRLAGGGRCWWWWSGPGPGRNRWSLVSHSSTIQQISTTSMLYLKKSDISFATHYLGETSVVDILAPYTVRLTCRYEL